MRLKKENDKNKLLGVYYTPVKLAEYLVYNFIPQSSVNSILEPSCGEGVFVRSLMKTCLKNKNITAVEIDNKKIESLKEKICFDNIKFLHSDFFDFYKNCKENYDLVIGNPPYIRYQYLNKLQRNAQSKILKSNGMKPNNLINAWVAFTVACTSLLSNNGTLVFVIPAELLQVAYANDLRKFLVDNFQSLDIIAFDEIIFPEIEQETVVLIGKKQSEKKGIRFFKTANVNTLHTIEIESVNYEPMPEPDLKWTTLLAEENASQLIEQIKNNVNFRSFSELAVINVGVTTGNNDFFSINKETNLKYDLKSKCIPLIGRSCYFSGTFVTKKDIQKNYDEGKKSHLLVIEDKELNEFDEKIIEYIKFGERNKVNKGYKCKIRKHWYSVPSIWIPDAFFARRNGEYPKVLMNTCKAVSTDTLHRIKFKEGVDKIEAVLSYYNSISFAFTEICGRSYGGGVLEILPTEALNIYLPIVKNLNDDEKKKILKNIDKKIRNGTPIEKVLDYTDKIILIDGLGLNHDYVMKFRKIWKTLQQRRLLRGKKRL